MLFGNKPVSLGSVVLLASVSSACACIWSGSEVELAWESLVPFCRNWPVRSGPKALFHHAVNCALQRWSIPEGEL